MIKEIIVKINTKFVFICAVIIFLFFVPTISKDLYKQVQFYFNGQMVKQTGFYYKESYYQVNLKYKKMFIDVNAPYYQEVEELNKNIK